jgi:UDP-2-acetamido-3-amino-2,3-dideoxy-glucuronate N-acetyltransferase
VGEWRVTFIGDFTVIRDNIIIGDNCIIGPLNVIESNVIIGNNVTIQPHCVISRGAIIEDNVFIGPHFSCANNPFIPDGEHGLSPNKRPDKEMIMKICKGTRIGTRCTVAPGVTIGKNCFIKMNCNIYDDVPDNTIVYQNTSWAKDYD